MGCGKNSFKLVWRCHQLLSGFLPNDHLPRVSWQSPLSANDKGDNEVKPGAMHRSPRVYLTTEGNPGKPQPGDRLTNTVRPVASNGVPYLQMTSMYVLSQTSYWKIVHFCLWVNAHKTSSRLASSTPQRNYYNL